MTYTQASGGLWDVYASLFGELLCCPYLFIVSAVTAWAVWVQVVIEATKYSSISLSRCSGGHGLLLAGQLDDWGNGWCCWASWRGGGGVGLGMKPLCSLNAHKENPHGPRPWWLPRPLKALSEVREGRWDEDDLASDLGEPVGMVVQTFSGQCRGWPEEIHTLLVHTQSGSTMHFAASLVWVGGPI